MHLYLFCFKIFEFDLLVMPVLPWIQSGDLPVYEIRRRVKDFLKNDYNVLQMPKFGPYHGCFSNDSISPFHGPSAAGGVGGWVCVWVATEGD